MRLTSKRCGLIAGAMLVFAMYSNAVAQQSFLYQGRLLDAGAPVAGPINLTFKLFDAAIGGTQIGTDHDYFGFDEFAEGGLFSVELDFGAGSINGAQRWLEVWVNGAPLDPRQELAATPYAHHAINAAMVVDGGLPSTYASAVDFSNNTNAFSGSFSGSGAGLTGLNASQLASGTVGSGRLAGTYGNALSLSNAGNAFTGDGGGLVNLDWDNLVNVPPGFADGVDDGGWSNNGNDLYYNAGNVGVGTSTPLSKLHVTTSALLSTIRGENQNEGGVGVFGYASAATGSGMGLSGTSESTSGYGVYGHAAATSSFTYGVYGISDSTGGRGVQGVATASSGSTFGLYGESQSTAGTGLFAAATSATGNTFGVYAQNQSSGGSGVFAIATAGSGGTVGVLGRSLSTSGTGVYGHAMADSGTTTIGVHGESESDFGYGVFGEATATSGTNYGVYGESSSTSGRGVYGFASATSGGTYGVYGQNASNSGRALYGGATAVSGTTFGVYAESDSTSGRGVFGHATASNGTTYGVYAQNDSSTGRGVYGNATSTSGTNYGVQGNTNSTSGRAIYGTAGASSGLTYGVYGWNNSTNGRAVYGWATANSGGNFGVYGESDSPTGIGVYGLGGDYAVFAEGDMGASGTKSFVIDHPLDPENKYLKHYCAEGPEPQNIYNGVVMLDPLGEAWIDLPEYFEAINRDPRYTLTPIGAAMPNLHVAEKVFDNTFRIAGGVPGLEVSWEVKAIRNDPYVQTYGSPVEVEKSEQDRGRYRHPELYGHPEEMGINWTADDEVRLSTSD